MAKCKICKEGNATYPSFTRSGLLSKRHMICNVCRMEQIFQEADKQLNSSIVEKNINVAE